MRRYLQAVRKQLILYILGAAIVQALTVSASVFNGRMLDALVRGSVRAFLTNTVCLMLIWMGVAGGEYLLAVYQAAITQDVDIQIRARLTDRLAATDYAAFHHQTLGTYVSWFNNDIQLINTQGLAALFPVISEVWGTLFALGMLAYYHWSLAAVGAVMAVVIVAAPKIFDRRLASRNLTLTRENEAFVSHTEDALSSFDFLLPYHALRLIRERIVTASQTLKQANVGQTRIQAAVQATGLLGNVIAQVLIIGLSGILALLHIVTIGTISATGSLAGNVFNNLGNMSNFLGMIRGTGPIFAKLENAKTAFSEPPSTARVQQSLTSVTRTVFTLANVTYRYGQAPVLTDVTLQFTAGKKYLITGPSGSGKSTLLKLLAGYDESYTGTLSFRGQDYRRLPAGTLQQQVLYLSQQPGALNTTVRENLTLLDDYSDAVLTQALLAVALIPNAAAAPAFLDTPVGPHGSNLSGGQLQRLALARGLLRHFPVILLDEGTSAVDPANAVAIERMLLTNPQLTLIMISHTVHPETLPLFDDVIRFPLTASPAVVAPGRKAVAD